MVEFFSAAVDALFMNCVPACTARILVNILQELPQYSNARSKEIDFMVKPRTILFLIFDIVYIAYF